MKTKKWYSVSILYRGKENITNHQDIWEETICLFDAENEAEVREKAEEKSKSAEIKYQSISGNTVDWVFDGILSVYELSEESIVNGTEVFSRFLREDEVKSLRTPFEDE